MGIHTHLCTQPPEVSGLTFCLSALISNRCDQYLYVTAGEPPHAALIVLTPELRWIRTQTLASPTWQWSILLCQFLSNLRICTYSSVVLLNV